MAMGGKRNMKRASIIFLVLLLTLPPLFLTLNVIIAEKWKDGRDLAIFGEIFGIGAEERVTV